MGVHLQSESVFSMARNTHHADIYTIEGDSYRKKEAMKSKQKIG
jgi:hypothetical protein